ncbi:NAD-dependent epimerase/dehydratase family protein [Halopseudomonas pelagia]|uniref:NAD-dependent epimerase/dehydratase family protein n=1 Tax=Halopseudomonas pelagia TaxID=553151 RepID=UPI003C6D249F
MRKLIASSRSNAGPLMRNNRRLEMRVFIVGATGGVGHRVAQRLRASGHAITAVVRRQSRPRAAYNRGSLRSSQI